MVRLKNREKKIRKQVAKEIFALALTIKKRDGWFNLDLLEEDIKLENLAKAVVEWEREYRKLNNLGPKAPDSIQALATVLGLETN